MAMPDVLVMPEIDLCKGVSTKGLNYEDAIARVIAPDFLDVVDPRMLIMYLPPDLLTPADEDRVVTRQDSMGRVEACKTLLALMCQRGDWVPRLQQGLRHREIRLEELAAKIDNLQGEVQMEIDFPEDAANDMLMEVDSEPFTHTLAANIGGKNPQHPTQGGEALTTSPADSLQPLPAAVSLQFQDPRATAPPGTEPLIAPGQASAQAQPHDKLDTRAVLREIALHFFTRLATTPEHVARLTQELRCIAEILTTGYAVGCLEMRIRVLTSRDLRQLRRLVDSGVLHDVVERSVLSNEQRDWLKKEAASYRLTWRQMNLKITISREDLDRCETFLKVREETADPRNAAEALLQKARARAWAATALTEPEMADPRNAAEALLQKLGVRVWATTKPTAKLTTGDPEHHTLPDLLLSFLDRHPDCAKVVASTLAKSTLPTLSAVLSAAIDFHLSSRSLNDGSILGNVAFSMLYNSDPKETGPKQATTEQEGPSDISSLCLKLPLESFLEYIVHDLVFCGWMVPIYISGKHCGFRFAEEYLADIALACVPLFKEPPDDYVSRVLRVGSPFVILSLISMLAGLSWWKDAAKETHSTISRQLFKCMSGYSSPSAVRELYLACYDLIEDLEDPEVLRTFFQSWHWQTFHPKWKHRMQVMGSAPASILLCPLTDEEMDGLGETAREVLSAKHTVDLTGKLSDLSENQLRVLMACVQLTNVATFSLEKKGPMAALRPQSSDQIVRPGQAPFSQPALTLSKNILEERHIECLVSALPGLESVSYFDLSCCTISLANLQRLLNKLCMLSVKTLMLNGISFTDVPVPKLPRFSHLKRLQVLELGSMGLGDRHMAELAWQLRELPDLRELTLEENPISTEGLSQLTTALACCSSLRALRLKGCQLDAGGAFVLGALLMKALSLHVLNVSHIPLEDSGLQHLSFLLRSHRLLTKVSLRDGGYSPAGLASFLTYLSDCRRMQHLELGRCALEEEGMDVSGQLIKALAGSWQWDFLGLWQCRLGHTSFLQQLPDKLSGQLQGMTSLILQDNDLDDTQVGHLTEAVRRGVFRYLKVLNLSQNNIVEAGAKQLGSVLHFLPHISELLMQNSAVPVEGAVSLVLAALPLPNMTFLDLSDSYGITQFEVTEVVSKIANFVLDEGVVIGIGVGYAEGNAASENLYLTEKLQLLKLDEEREKLEVSTEKGLTDLPEEMLEYEFGKAITPLQILPTTPEDPAGRLLEPNRREITVRESDTIIMNGMFKISFRHHT